MPTPTACISHTWYLYVNFCRNRLRDSSDAGDKYASLQDCCEENLDPPLSNKEYATEPSCPYDRVYNARQ